MKLLQLQVPSELLLGYLPFLDTNKNRKSSITLCCHIDGWTCKMGGGLDQMIFLLKTGDFQVPVIHFRGGRVREIEKCHCLMAHPPPHSDRCDSETPPLQSWGRKIHDSNKHLHSSPQLCRHTQQRKGYRLHVPWWQVNLFMTYFWWIGVFLKPKFLLIWQNFQAALFLGLLFF